MMIIFSNNLYIGKYSNSSKLHVRKMRQTIEDTCLFHTNYTNIVLLLPVVGTISLTT